MTEFIDMTPTWRSILGYLFVGIEDGNAEGRKIAKEEFLRMAIAADMYNLLSDRLEVENLAQIIRAVDGNNELEADQLAKAVREELLKEKE